MRRSVCVGGGSAANGRCDVRFAEQHRQVLTAGDCKSGAQGRRTLECSSFHASKRSRRRNSEPEVERALAPQRARARTVARMMRNVNGCFRGVCL